MPTIRSSADLRNSYNEISTFCHNYSEPVFITKNGKGDLAVMSIEAMKIWSVSLSYTGLSRKVLPILQKVKPARFPKPCLI